MSGLIDTSSLIPEVSPNGYIPNAEQRIQTSPETFGAGLGRSVEQAGAVAASTASFYGQVAADDQSNKFIDGYTKILHGDPSKLGPDGNPDTGYLGLKGRAAMDARPDVENKINDLLQQTRGNLTSPEQLMNFDRDTRRLRAGVISQIGSHVDREQNSWFGSVNKSSADIAAMNIATNASDPKAVEEWTSRLVTARQNDAIMHGAKPGDPVFTDAVNGAKQEALRAQVEALSVKDPSGAMKLLESKKAVAGTLYEPLAKSLQSRANDADAVAVANKALGAAHTNAATPAPGAAQLDAVGQKYGISGDYLARSRQIESGNNPNQTSPTGAQGPWQFIPSTWKKYGVGSPFDMNASAEAAARLAADNRDALAKSLGRAPTDAEIYLAHQQGAGGAAKLLANPTARAGDLVGDKAISVNGGNPNAPASDFVNMWAAKFGGHGVPTMAPGGGQTFQMPANVSGANPAEIPTFVPDPVSNLPQAPAPAPATDTAPPAAPHIENLKADAYQQILNDPHLTEEVREKALHHVSQALAAQQIAEAADAKARAEANDKAANGYVTEILNGKVNPQTLTRIANDPALKWETKETMTRLAQEYAGSDVDKANKAYGPGFWKAYRGVTAPAGSPDRIAGQQALLERAGPGGDLTLAGAEKLIQVQNQTGKSVNDANFHASLAHVIEGYKQNLSFDQEMAFPSMPPIKDPKGQIAFNVQFVPRVMAELDKIQAEGKNPWDYIADTKHLDEIAEQIRPKRQMQMDRLAAVGEGTPNDKRQESAPPPPAGVDPAVWAKVINQPPLQDDGRLVGLGAYNKAINILLNDPSPKTQAFFDSHFAKNGMKAAEILQQLQSKDQK